MPRGSNSPPARWSEPGRQGAAHCPAGEEAAAQESSFQRVVAVGAPAAEACSLAGSVQAGDADAVLRERLPG
jgi:hypothetical protein